MPIAEDLVAGGIAMTLSRATDPAAHSLALTTSSRLDSPRRCGLHLPSSSGGLALHVEVEPELVWVRTQAYLRDLARAFELQPRLDHVHREDASLGQELVVLFQGVERF